MAEQPSRRRGGIEDLARVRTSLALILEKSRTIAEENAGSISRRHLETLSEAKRGIRRAVRSGSVVLKKFEDLHDLEPCLLADPLADLAGFLAALDRQEDILRFLRENCTLAIRDLEDGVNYVKELSILDGRSISGFKSLVSSLKKSAIESSFHGGLLDEVLGRIEIAFRRLIVNLEEDKKIHFPSIQNLIQILWRISALGCLERYVEIYAEIRASAAQMALRDLIIRFEKDQVTDWMKCLKFAVKHVFQKEFKLCHEVWSLFEPEDLWVRCFAEIALRGGILSLLQFGTRIAKRKDDTPEQLFDLLKMFCCLIRLRQDFNRLFGRKPCAEIQNATRGLIKNIVNRSCKIFRDLGNQTAITSVIECCNNLLGDDYRPHLSQILAIDRSWRGENFQKDLLREEILNLINSLERNVEEASESYELSRKCYIFRMNTHMQFYKNLRGTRLEKLLGAHRVREHNDCTTYYSVLYLTENWAKLLGLLNGKELILITRGRSRAKDLIKKQLRSFNEALDEICRIGTFSLIADQDLRERVCRSAVQTVVPVYRSFLQSYGALAEREGRPGKYVKHSPESLERLICSLFHLKPQLTEIL